MSMTRLFPLVLWLATAQLALNAADPSTATTNSGPRTYRNPLLPDVEMADPDVIRVNGAYYL